MSPIKFSAFTSSTHILLRHRDLPLNPVNLCAFLGRSRFVLYVVHVFQAKQGRRVKDVHHGLDCW